MLIKNARDAEGRKIEVLVRDGVIAALGLDLEADGEDTLDAGGLTLLPAFIDTHTHWRTPGFE